MREKRKYRNIIFQLVFNVFILHLRQRIIPTARILLSKYFLILLQQGKEIMPPRNGSWLYNIQFLPRINFQYFHPEKCCNILSHF